MRWSVLTCVVSSYALSSTDMCRILLCPAYALSSTELGSLGTRHYVPPEEFRHGRSASSSWGQC
eukprot:2087453-Rhodomonas_salina.2